MASFTDFLEDELLDHAFRNSVYAPPATVYLALFTAAPSDAGGGTEVSGNGYSRQTVAFGASSGGAISNTNAITFTASGGAWGTITHVGYFDAATAGNMMAWSPLGASKSIADTDSLTFAIGDLDITLS